MEILQTIEEKQEIKETDKIISATNEHQVTNMHRHLNEMFVLFKRTLFAIL